MNESPAYMGRRRVLLVEGRRREATVGFVREVADRGLTEGVEVWDWRVLESVSLGKQGGDRGWFLGCLKWEDRSRDWRLEDGVE